MADQLFEIRTDDKDHQRAMRKMQQDLDKVIAKNVKLTEQVARGTKEQKKSFDTARQGNSAMLAGLIRVTSQITSAAAGYFTLRTAVEAVNIELAEQVRLSQEAAGSQRTLAVERQKLRFNIGSLPEAEKRRAVARIDEISRETGVFPSALTAPVGAAFSAGGDLDAALESVRIAAKILPESFGELAEALQDVARATGDKNVLANIGFLARAVEQARTTTPGDFAKNVVPSIVDLTERGDRDVFAAALGSVLTRRFIRTEKAATAMIRFAATLEKVVPEGKTTEERLALAQADPRIARRVIENLEEGATKGGLTKLLDAQSTSAKELVLALRSLEQVVDRTASGKGAVAAVGDDPVVRADLARRRLQAFAERRRTDPQPIFQGLPDADKFQLRQELGIRGASGGVFQFFDKFARFFAGVTEDEATFAIALAQFRQERARRQESGEEEPSERESKLRELLELLRQAIIADTNANDKLRAALQSQGASRALDSNVRD